MFTELLPIVRNRKVTIIIKHDADDTLTVNVVPIQLRADENPALCTPLSDVGVTGTAAELDRDFPQALTGYVAQHLTLAQALNQSAAEMEAAKKSAADAAKQASKDASEKWKKTKSGGPQAPAKPTPAAPPARAQPVRCSSDRIDPRRSWLVQHASA
jgi:PRTRC genetic system protein E